MDQSQNSEEQTAFKEIQKAQRTLEDVQSKIKRFKSRKREKSQTTITKAPFPDLNQYFSYLTSDPQEDYDKDELLLQHDPKSRNPSNYEGLSKMRLEEKENFAMSINDKLEKEKNSSINKIEEFYVERNEALEEKIREMKVVKEKIVKDQKLLLRNNKELEEELSRVRAATQRRSSEKMQSLREKIEKMKEKIGLVQTENSKAHSRKKDLEKHVKQVLKAHKQTLSYEGLIRQKSSSVKRCQYH